ncbi:MAG: TVP38/TMEM64 family protein [Sedimentisphaerales bacterium]|nr:TVP38/TMEM64 family protein [Sedimentisphaerales bacterium]
MTETENKSEMPLPPNKQRNKKIAKIIVLVIIVLIVVVGIKFLPIKDWLIKSLEWTQGLGFWGYVFVAAFYIVACVLLLPGSILTLGAGFIFKVVRGSITVSIGSTLGACAAFLVGRTVARKWIAAKVAKNEKFAAIDEAVAQQGFKIVLLTRLSPVFPFNMLNYAFGLTKISFWKYALGSWIGMMPGTIMYVYFGAGLRSLADVAAGNVEKSTAGTIFFWVGLVATIVVTVFVTRIARNALRQAVPQTTSETIQTKQEQQI